MVDADSKRKSEILGVIQLAWRGEKPSSVTAGFASGSFSAGRIILCSIRWLWCLLQIPFSPLPKLTENSRAKHVSKKRNRMLDVMISNVTFCPKCGSKLADHTSGLYCRTCKHLVPAVVEHFRMQRCSKCKEVPARGIYCCYCGTNQTL